MLKTLFTSADDKKVYPNLVAGPCFKYPTRFLSGRIPDWLLCINQEFVLLCSK